MTVYTLPYAAQERPCGFLPWVERSTLAEHSDFIQQQLLAGRAVPIRMDVVCADTVLEIINEMDGDPLRSLVQWQQDYSNAELGAALRHLIHHATKEVAGTWARARYDEALDECLHLIPEHSV